MTGFDGQVAGSGGVITDSLEAPVFPILTSHRPENFIPRQRRELERTPGYDR